jgi:Glycerol-3-phosphate dehydrogenase
MADGLGYGDNTKAALITRGIKEISRLGVAMGANTETLNGLSGIGDLIVTCASRHSRNRKAGMLIGRGYSMQQAMDEVKMVVEGVYSAKAAIALAKKYEINMPIIEQVNAVLFENQPAKDAVMELMLRDKKAEHEDILW